MKDVQCYELFGGIALKNYTFSFFFIMLRSSFQSTFFSCKSQTNVCENRKYIVFSKLAIMAVLTLCFLADQFI